MHNTASITLNFILKLVRYYLSLWNSDHIKFFFLILFIYLFIYGCVGFSFLCEGFLLLRQVGATLHRSAQASHHRGLSCCRVQATDAQAQQLWLTGLVAPRHVGSSQTRAQTHVPCIGRQILNHCATREAPKICLMSRYVPSFNLAPLVDVNEVFEFKESVFSYTQ